METAELDENVTRFYVETRTKKSTSTAVQPSLDFETQLNVTDLTTMAAL